MTDATMMLGLDDYAARHGMSTRTVRRALDAGEIAGATKVGGRWAIPATAVRQVRTTAVATTTPTTAPTVHPLTVGAVLETQPVFLDLETASHILGVSTYAMRTNAEFFQLVRMGERGAYVMPKSRIRELNGDI